MRTIKYQVRAPKSDHVVDSFTDEERAKRYVKERRPVQGDLRLVRMIITEHELAV